MPTAFSTKNLWIKQDALKNHVALALILSCILSICTAGTLYAKAKGVPVVQNLLRSTTLSKDECLSEECKQIASSVLSKMKPGVNPCDDFYEFACGTFLDEAKIPDDKAVVSTFSMIGDNVQEQVYQLIKAERPATDPKHYRLPNMLYKACMNEEHIECLGTSPIVKMIEAMGGWPVLLGDRWDLDGIWSWEKQTAEYRTNYILAFNIGPDNKNNSRYIIKLDQPSFGLSREYLAKGLSQKEVSAYYEYMVDIAVLFGANKTRAQEELLTSLEFEIALATISLPAEELRDLSKLNNIHTIGQLQQRYPYVQWLLFMNSLLPHDNTITGDELINLKVPRFFDELGPLLTKTPNRVIANYMMYRIHLSLVPYLSKDFRNRELQYKKEKNGIRVQMPRWKKCVDTVIAKLPIAVGSLYVHNYFNQESKAIALDMINNIKWVFNGILNNVTWMDKVTKEEVKKKLRHVYAHVGYPDELLDNKKLADYYDKLGINEKEFFASHLKINKFNTDKEYNNLHQPVNKTDWKHQMEITDVNAYYNPSANSIQIPAGILQGYFFNAQRPFYMNYGAIGQAIGHELTHGFDDKGSQVDYDGSLHNWWQDESAKEYLKKVQCIVKQYGNYTETLTGLKVNGINTQGENIADNGGTKQAYFAYKRWVIKNGNEPTLPGLNYTGQQMFWIAFAQSWCHKSSKEDLKERIITDDHAPPQFRILGTLKNMKDFSNDFQCAEGSAMNPVHKCEVW